jgi:RND family efflux transporter MFP subunit
MKSSARGVSGFFVTLAAVTIAAGVSISIWNYYIEAPWTRDGRVVADVVEVAPDVSGLVTEVAVKDNESVHRGDVLFQIDRDRFELALAQAEAVVAQKEATNQQAASDFRRYSVLSDAAVSRQKLEVAQATAQAARAALDQAIADRDLAKLNLDRSTVRAYVDGRITNMNLQPGAYVSVGHGVMALIAESTLRVEGYFEETKLGNIRVGEQATVRLMGQEPILSGRVQSVAGGIVDRERTQGSNLLANVNPTFNWVRLAQRIPVRIALDALPPGVRLVAGQTATVSVGGEGTWRFALR